MVKAGDELFDENPGDGTGIVPITAGLQTTKGGTAGQGRISIDGRLPGRIVQEGVMIIVIFVTVGDAVDAFRIASTDEITELVYSLRERVYSTTL